MKYIAEFYLINDGSHMVRQMNKITDITNVNIPDSCYKLVIKKFNKKDLSSQSVPVKTFYFGTDLRVKDVKNRFGTNKVVLDQLLANIANGGKCVLLKDELHVAKAGAEDYVLPSDSIADGFFKEEDLLK